MVGLPALSLAERIATIASELGIQTALFGASALAAHNYIPATIDVDLATRVDPRAELRTLEQALRETSSFEKRSARERWSTQRAAR